MPLTVDERHLVYEILGVPDADAGLSVYSQDPWTTGTFQHSLLTAKTEIDAVLDLVDADATLVTRLQALLVEWGKVSTSATRLHPLGENQGVDRNPAKIRKLIRDRVLVIVPVRVGDGGSGNELLLA